jgi:hypothetical protein
LKAMTQVPTNSSNAAGGGPNKVAKLAGNTFAYSSLLCSAFFWFDLVFYCLPGAPESKATGFDWFRIMGAAVILSGAAAACRVKLWKLALPVALAMFFFVMGT